MSFNLGKSFKVSQVSEQQILDADRSLNRFLVDSVAFATVGLGYGILFSILFKKKGKILGYGAGFGLGTAIYKNCGQDIDQWWRNLGHQGHK